MHFPHGVVFRARVVLLMRGITISTLTQPCLFVTEENVVAMWFGLRSNRVVATDAWHHYIDLDSNPICSWQGGSY